MLSMVGGIDAKKYHDTIISLHPLSFADAFRALAVSPKTGAFNVVESIAKVIEMTRQIFRKLMPKLL